jgi:hypothetical protein
MNDLEPFAKLVQALDAWRSDLIFVGGWAHRLHRLDSRANELEHQAVFTRDSDLALSSKVPPAGDILASLKTHGFREQLSGDFKPPVAQYSLGNERRGFYAEFLTPLVGSPTKRSGEPNATLAVAGISAQKVKYLDILLLAPWVITLDPTQGIPVPERTDVLVANPLCFMVQKFLIWEDRRPQKRAQDLLYVYDTIELFGHLQEDFQDTWLRTISPELGPRQSKAVMKRISETFSNVNDTLRAAARIPQDRTLAAEEMRLTCQVTFEQIFGVAA